MRFSHRSFLYPIGGCSTRRYCTVHSVGPGIYPIRGYSKQRWAVLTAQVVHYTDAVAMHMHAKDTEYFLNLYRIKQVVE